MAFAGGGVGGMRFQTASLEGIFHLHTSTVQSNYLCEKLLHSFQNLSL